MELLDCALIGVYVVIKSNTVHVLCVYIAAIRQACQQKITDIFLISPRKHMLWYSLEAPRRGASNEYPQHMFSWRNKKKYLMDTLSYLKLHIKMPSDTISSIFPSSIIVTTERAVYLTAVVRDSLGSHVGIPSSA